MTVRKTLLVVLVLGALVATPPTAEATGIPVVDLTNLVQSTISAIEDVNQAAQLVVTYKNELAQYERMLTDGVVPLVYAWDKITNTVDLLRTANQSVRNGRGALSAELKQFLDPNYYRSSNCYNSQGAKGGCYEGYRKLMQALQERETDAQQRRDDQLEAQLQTLSDRAEKEKTLQDRAGAAKGQLEAIQYTNQLLDAQYAELRDTRALLITQQQVAAEQQRKALAQQAAAQALSDRWHSGDDKFKRSTPGSW